MNPAARDRLRDRIMYLHAAIRELKNIAESERCDTLAYLLEMAYLDRETFSAVPGSSHGTGTASKGEHLPDSVDKSLFCRQKPTGRLHRVGSLGEGATLTEPKIRTGLELNRLFYEGRGDEFIDTFADYVARQEIAVSEGSVIRLLDTVRAIGQTRLKTGNPDG
ncbi:hypothetical protein [Mesorhizobium sp. IMUNJ 23232]|uniref:hypothetical protein n=1 Tax=Mesorhizobium sp. IMUNJ 23232 TaxID=3376064 RepID=UPI003791D2AC